MPATPKLIKKSNSFWNYIRCERCGQKILSQNKHVLHVVDSRNGKVCITCAVNQLDTKIKSLKTQIKRMENFKKEIKNKVMLENLEEEENSSTNS